MPEEESLLRRKKIRIHKKVFPQYTVSTGTAFYAGAIQYGEEKNKAQRKDSSPVRAFMPLHGRPDRTAIFSYDMEGRCIQRYGGGTASEGEDAEGSSRQNFRQKWNSDC